MPLFKRKITYFYEHHKGIVGNTAGFLKLEIRGDKVKMIINIQESSAFPYEEAGLYFYHEAGEHLSAIKVGKVERMAGMLTYQSRTDWKNLFETGRDLYTFDGVAVVYDTLHYYIGDFQDKNRQEFPLEIANLKTERKEEKEEKWYEELDEKGLQENEKKTEKKKSDEMETDYSVESHLKEPQDNQQENLQEGKNVYRKCENCPYHKKRMEQEENKNAFDKMIKEYPKLPMYGAQELMDCVRIHPKDIGKLDMRNWKLGVNSFLTHGFYTYQYLLLGKMIFDNGTEQPVIGVPGVYSNREKYVANMFGFEQFIPIKKTGIKTGEFGYWIVEIQ